MFPLPPNSKKPAKPDTGEPSMGVRSASNSEAQVQTWWEQWPDANIGGTGFLVLDCDEKPEEGISGSLNLEVWCAERGVELPDTLEFQSQGGGRHLIYRANMAHPFGQGDVAEGVNVRAPHMGYICLPGSTIDGRPYTVHAKRAVADAPAEVQAASAVGKRERTEETTIAEGAELDHPVTLARAQAYLEGAGGELILASNPGAFEVACRLMDWGVAPPTVYQMGLPYCQPSWVSTWDQCVQNAMTYRQNKLGGQGTAGGAPSAELLRIAATIGQSIADAIRPPQEARTFPLMPWKDATKSEEYLELVEDLIPHGEFGILYGKWGSYKTFIAIHIACHWSRGEDVLGRKSFEPGPVLYIAAENAASVRMRMAAFRLRHGDAQVDVIPAAVRLNDAGEVAALIEQVKDKGYKLVVIDTLAKCTPGMDDVSTEASSLMLLACETLCRSLNATVLGVGHEGKNDSGTLRGSSNTEAGATFMLRCEKMPGERPTAKVTVYKAKDDAGGVFYLQGREQDTGWRKRHRDTNTLSLVFEVAQEPASAAATAKEIAWRREVVERLGILVGADTHQGATYAQLAKAMAMSTEALRKRFQRTEKRFSVGPDLSKGIPGYMVEARIGTGACDMVFLSSLSQVNEETPEN